MVVFTVMFDQNEAPNGSSRVAAASHSRPNSKPSISASPPLVKETVSTPLSRKDWRMILSSKSVWK